MILWISVFWSDGIDCVFFEFSMVVISCYVEVKVWWFGLVWSEETSYF